MPTTTRRLTGTPLSFKSKLRQLSRNRSASLYSSDQYHMDENDSHDHQILSFEKPVSRRISIIKPNTHTEGVASSPQCTYIPRTGTRNFSLPASTGGLYFIANSSPQTPSHSESQSNRSSINQETPLSPLSDLADPYTYSFSYSSSYLHPHLEEECEEQDSHLDSSAMTSIRSLQAQLQDLEMEYMNLREGQEKIYPSLASSDSYEDTRTWSSPFVQGWSWAM